jgi:hypothetical protein
MSFSEDPTQGTEHRAGAGEDPAGPGAPETTTDPTQGAELGEQAYEDPTQGDESGQAAYEVPTQGTELGSASGEDPMAPST